MSQNSTVPRLNLAPKLDRPLSLWNPFDYLRLLYWVFYFPQAFRWYLETFEGSYTIFQKFDPIEAFRIIKNSKIQVTLLIQGFFLTLFIPVFFCYLLQKINFSINWYYVSFFIILSLILGLFLCLSLNVLLGIALWISLGIGCSITAGISENFLIAFTFGLALICVSNVGQSLSQKNPKALSFFYLIGSFSWLVIIVLLFLIFIFLFNISMKPINILIFIGIECIALLHPEIWLVGILCNWHNLQNQSFLFPRITMLPLSRLELYIEKWLKKDWIIGIKNINQIIRYTHQNIPVIKALNYSLNLLPSEQIIYKISQIAKFSLDWELMGLLTTSLDKQIQHNFLEGFSFWRNDLWFDPLLLEKAHQKSLPHATAAGFWYLYNKEPTKAAEAFTVVRSLLYGEEMYSLSYSLALCKKAETSQKIAQLELPFYPQDNLLRPGTWQAINSLKNVIQDRQSVEKSASRVTRFLALNRAQGKLQNILNNIEQIPEAERGIIEDIAKTWLDSLLNLASEIGTSTITQPVTIPYVIGDPVEGKLFVGREDILRELESYWMGTEKPPSVVLFGHRRMGKTSILRNISHCLGSTVQVSYINCQCLGTISLGVGEVLMAITDKLADTFNIDPPNDQELLTLPQRTFERYLKNIVKQLGEKRLIIALDEFEIIEKLIEADKIPSDFMDFLRGMIQLSSQIAFAFAGLHTLEEMTSDYFQPFYGSVIPVQVSFLSRAATYQLLANPRDDFPLEYTEESLNRIHQVTAGQAYLVQLIGFQLVRFYNTQVFETGRKRDPMFTIEDVEVVINDPEFLQRGHYYFHGVWDQAAKDVLGQQEILKQLASYPQGLTQGDLMTQWGMTSSEVENALNTLKRHDVIQCIDKSWKIRVELFRRWLVQKYAS